MENRNSCELVLVTGGAGFIGSHLVQRLLEMGLRVRVLDNLSTGSMDNLSEFRNHANLEFISADIRDEKLIQPYFKSVDWVFHVAALADIVPSINKPMDYYSTNVTGTTHVLEHSRNAKVKRFVYVASSSSYGISDEIPTSENAPIQCEYPYALTKYLGEVTTLHWNKVYGLPSVILKFFNIYGPRARTTGTYGAVFGVFLSQKLHGKPFTIVGDGEQTRDFTYVTDAVDALVVAAQSNVEGEVFNVGSGGTYSVNRLTELLGGDKVHIPKRPGEPDITFADISKIKRRLNWEPKISFEEGVKRMLDHIQDWQKAPVWTKESIAEATKDWFKCLS